MLKRTKQDILEGNIPEQLLLFFFPVLLGYLFQQLYNTIDAMIIHLGRLYNMEMTKQFAVSLLTPVLNSFAGRFLAQTIISWIPGAKNFVGSPLAFGLTKVVGMSILSILSSGRDMEQITAEDIQNASKDIDFIECAKEYNSQSKD